MDQLVYLALVLLIGTVSWLLSSHLKTSSVFLLLLTGMVFGAFGLIRFSQEVIVMISAIALIVLVFDSASRFRFRELASHANPAVRMSIFFAVLIVVVLAVAAVVLASLPLGLAAIFAVLILGVDSSLLLDVLGPASKNYVALKMESLILTPASVILPLLMLGVASQQGPLSSRLAPLLQEVVIAIGIGMVVGFIVVAVLRQSAYAELSYLTLMSASIVAYVAANLLNATGILAVAVVGLLYANSRMPQHAEIEKRGSIALPIFTVLVFVIVGAMMQVPSSYVLAGTVLFLVYLALRYFAVHIFMTGNLKERLFITMNVPAGVGVASITLLMANLYHVPSPLVSLTLLFVMYSIVLSTVATTLGTSMLQIKKS